jgi:uncharacterized protein
MSHPLRHLDLFVTEACNLACPYCFARERRDVANMPVEMAYQAIAWLCDSSSPRVHITFWGGEPLLRLAWLTQVAGEFQRQASNARKSTSMSLPTNATLLSDEALSWIRRFDVKVFLSIDGDEGTQARRPLASGKNSHELASAGLRAALSQRPRRPISVRMTVTPDNVEQLPDNVLYFANQGVRRLMVYPAYDQPWSPSEIQAFGCAEQRVAKMLATWIRQTPAPRVPVRLDGWVPTLRALAGMRDARLPSESISPCGVGDSLVALNVDGRFAPCHRFTFYGRAKGEPWNMGDVSGGPRSFEAFQGLCWDRQHGDGPCTDCESFPLCTMGCVAINFATTGDLLRVPPWACALQRQRIRACRSLHDMLCDHPAYAAYLGQPASWVLQTHAQDMGKRAAKLWSSLSQPRNEPWQSST